MSGTVLFLLGGLSTLAGVAALWVYSRSGKPEPVPFRVFRCPACGQKLRYRAQKAGRAGMCPRCRQRWTLPAGEGAPVAQETPAGSYRAKRERILQQLDRITEAGKAK